MPLSSEEEVTILRLKNEELQKSLSKSKIWTAVFVTLFVLETVFSCLMMFALSS